MGTHPRIHLSKCQLPKNIGLGILIACSMKLKLVASVKYFSTKHRDTPQYPYFQMPSHKRFGLETLLQPQLLMQVRLKLVVAVHTEHTLHYLVHHLGIFTPMIFGLNLLLWFQICGSVLF